MGKSLIVPGADFRTNGIPLILDITALAEAQSGTFKPRYALTAFTSNTPSVNATRCCILNLRISDLADMSRFSKFRVDILPGFDYVLGINRVGGINDWVKASGESTGGSFTWVTSNQYILTDVSPILMLKGNIRYDNNTTQFATTTKLSDVVRLTLIP